MKLVGAQVINYRSIFDSGWVEVGQVCCLVGKNESGKTNFLRALERLNPADPTRGEFDLTDDYPRPRLTTVEREHQPGDLPVVVTAGYELTAAEVARFAELFGVDAVSGPIRSSKTYDNKKSWDFEIDQARVVSHLADNAGLPQAIDKAARAAGTIAELLAVLDEHATDTAAATLAQSINAWPGADIEREIIRHLAAWEPPYLYFGDYSMMPGRVSVPALKLKLDSGELDRADRTFVALLERAGAGLHQFETEADYERNKARLEGAGLEISAELYALWKQNKSSKIVFDKSGADPNAPAPLNQGINLHVRVEGRHGNSVPVDQRSHGFIWFFSFLVYFGEIKRQYNNRQLVLLLDEPGLALHALAQADFLEVIEERLATDHQVLYTTHSPFMVDSSRLDRVRLVEDVEEGDRNGTIISDDVYRVRDDTVFPLQAALGYEIGQTLFVAPNVLLVEGSSDLAYLQFLSRAVERNGGEGLSRQWAITPVGGISKMATFVKMFGANQLHTCLMVDAGTGNRQAIDKLVEDGRLDAKQIVEVNEVLNGDRHADIEDIFDEDFYLDLVKGGYFGTAAAALTLDLINESPDPRIVKRVEAKLADFSIKEFSHLKPAVYLEREQAAMLDKLSKATVTRATKLIKRINDQLR